MPLVKHCNSIEKMGDHSWLNIASEEIHLQQTLQRHLEQNSYLDIVRGRIKKKKRQNSFHRYN